MHWFEQRRKSTVYVANRLVFDRFKRRNCRSELRIGKVNGVKLEDWEWRVEDRRFCYKNRGLIRFVRKKCTLIQN